MITKLSSKIIDEVVPQFTPNTTTKVRDLTKTIQVVKYPTEKEKMDKINEIIDVINSL